MNCRGCNTKLSLTFLDLGVSPIANDLIYPHGLDTPEVFYPLHVRTCMECSFVQLPEVATRESLFRADYVYFSSYSTSWLEHSKSYAFQMSSLLGLSNDDLVVEIASNDGYLLQYFMEQSIQVLGIEPASGVAGVAIGKGIPTIKSFFGSQLGKQLAENKKPMLMIGNNVLAHVPDIHDFIEGFAFLVSDNGLITFEFPHLLSHIINNQFDTIYHEHYSYLSVTSLLPIFKSHKLKVVNVEKLSTHGGSIRIFVAKTDSNWTIQESVESILLEELEHDPRKESVWKSIQVRTLETKIDLLSELIACKKAGIRVAAYGAAAKGNTLLNYTGLDSDLIEYVIDLNPHKQGNYLPGSRIPILDVSVLDQQAPDVLLILPWNLAQEIKHQLVPYTNKGMKLLRAIPRVEYL